MNNTAICEELLKPSGTQSGKNSEAETIRREDILIELNLAWFAGIIDGEGCVQAYLVPNPARQHKDLRVMLVVSNTKPAIFAKASRLLNALSVKFHFSTGKRIDRENYVFSMQIAGKAKLKILLPRLLPYLTIKKDEVELVLSLLSYLEERVVSTSYSTIHTDEDPIILAKITMLKQLKRKGLVTDKELGIIPSTTTRSALPNMEGDDIVCSA